MKSYSLAQLNSISFDILDKHFKAQRVKPNWRPGFEVGDISSDLCIRLAKKTHLDPKLIGESFCNNFPSDFGKLEFASGFLNLTLSNSALESWSDDSDNTTKKVTVVVPKLLGIKSRESFLRIVAPAFLQVILSATLNIETTLEIDDISYPISRNNLDTLPNLFIEVLNNFNPNTKTKTKIGQVILDKLNLYEDSMIGVWMAGESFESSEWRLVSTHPKFYDDCQLRFIGKEILNQIDPYPVTYSNKIRSLEDLIVILFVLSSETYGTDLEWDLPWFNERGNLLWYLRSLSERLSKIPEEQVLYFRDQLSFRRAQYLIRFLGTFCNSAAIFADVGNYLGAVLQFSDIVNRALNDLKIKEKDSGSKMILSSVNEVFSRIIISLGLKL